MHEELDRPTTSDAKAAVCDCNCTSSGDDAVATRQSNFLAVQNDIGG